MEFITVKESDEEKKIVTKEEAEERVKENFETIKSAYGTIKFNKIFFGVCNALSLTSSVIGTGLLIASGLAAAPIFATLFGVSGTVYSAMQLRNQNLERNKMDLAWNKNVDVYEKIIEKSRKIG